MSDRIGLIGYRNHSGLGELNRQLFEHLDLSSWMLVSNRHRKTVPASVDRPTGIFIGGSFDKSNAEFIDSLDVLLFCETPFYLNLLREAKSRGKRIVCIPMLEWTPPLGKEWTSLVDQFVCPTRQCYDTLSGEGFPCTHLPWPVDTNRFSYRRRLDCKEFLFVNGHGGWGGRKGASVVARAKTLWPEMPLSVHSQSNSVAWPRGTNLLSPPKGNQWLYDDGDVLIVPHTCDGLGLEPMEAMACGMPVVTPNASPWNENPAIARINTTTGRKRVKRTMNWESCSAEHLVSICKSLLGKDIRSDGAVAWKWAEDNSWKNKRQDVLGAIVNED